MAHGDYVPGQTIVIASPPEAAPNGHNGGLVAALCRAQLKFPKLMKDQTAKVETRTGGGYSYRYADLGSLLEAIRKVLNDEGIAVLQPIVYEDGQHFLVTVLAHTSGENQTGRMRLTDHERPQELGSEITYKRRYALSSMVGIASEVDDDGAAAQGATLPPQGARRFYGSAKGPVHLPEAAEAGKSLEPKGDPEALRDISEELLPNTDAEKDDRAFLEKGVKRHADKHNLSTNERMAMQTHWLKGKAVNKADGVDLAKMYNFLNDSAAVESWRLEFKRKLDASPSDARQP